MSSQPPGGRHASPPPAVVAATAVTVAGASSAAVRESAPCSSGTYASAGHAYAGFQSKRGGYGVRATLTALEETRSSRARSRLGLESAGHARARTAPTSGCRLVWRASRLVSQPRLRGQAAGCRRGVPPRGGECPARRRSPRRRARARRPPQLVAGVGGRPPRLAADSPAGLDLPLAPDRDGRGLDEVRVAAASPSASSGLRWRGPRRLMDALRRGARFQDKGYRRSLPNGGRRFLAARASYRYATT